MSIIAIFSDLPEFARGVSNIVAEKTGFTYITEDDLIKEAAARYSVGEDVLAQSIECKIGIMHRLSSSTIKYISYLEAVLAEYLLRDKILCAGFVGYPLFKNVSHVLKVRMLCGIKDLIELNKLIDLPREQLEKGISFKEENYRKWVQYIYGLDITDSSLYDITLNVGNLTLDEAIDSIMHASSHERFQPMTYSVGCVSDQVVSSRVKAYLAEQDIRAEVKSKDGLVYLYTRGPRLNKKDQARKIKEELVRLEGVKQVEVYNEKELFDSISCGH